MAGAHRTNYSRGQTIGLVVLMGALGCLLMFRDGRGEKAWRFHGRTMGTFYGVQVVGERASKSKVKSVQRDVEALLREINSWMSTFDPCSEISRFNALSGTNAFPVSPGFAGVMGLALEVAGKSGGAFDPTVAPLVDLWGFGRKGEAAAIPTESEISAAMRRVGYRNVSMDDSPSVRKECPDVELDLSAIAKGYGVDRVAQLLTERGYVNILVDIGGEIVARGLNAKGSPWKISVETPNMGGGTGSGQYKVLSLDNSAVATSGDYRNYFKRGGKTYCHIIDPRNGRPVTNGVASVTVIGPNCVTADALATALTVLGPDRGMELLEEYRGVEAMLIIRNVDGSYRDVMSPGFARYLAGESR